MTASYVDMYDPKVDEVYDKIDVGPVNCDITVTIHQMDFVTSRVIVMWEAMDFGNEFLCSLIFLLIEILYCRYIVGFNLLYVGLFVFE